MCSKKCAKPDLPGSISLREPVCIGICSDTRLGNPVLTTTTLSPLGSVFSTVGKGKISAFLGSAGLAQALVAVRSTAKIVLRIMATA